MLLLFFCLCFFFRFGFFLLSCLFLLALDMLLARFGWGLRDMFSTTLPRLEVFLRDGSFEWKFVINVLFYFIFCDVLADGPYHLSDLFLNHLLIFRFDFFLLRLILSRFVWLSRGFLIVTVRLLSVARRINLLILFLRHSVI